ncbi:FtsH protease activity modulator HflK [Variovorax sp. MHTC-1]|uniref:FtsH protease activity modulator HflK n=1 Tax=Variovorax sp. MHTC-1 TaxID=2495593 RepID=UPI000F85BE8C|nr:FtsH protease activity modulator HflK [Variovorax sp. MHTC-1]RST53250.1 FtsH protease activity modulator HflK [Variovorax sp. MHTC-1]
MFNLNDGRWGRGDEPSSNGDRPNANRPDDEPTPPPGNNNRPRGQGPNQGPPDLDELWRDFNRKLGGLFGGRGGGNGGRPNGGNGGGLKPDMKNAGVGLGLVAAVAVLIWLGTGFFIVNEGQQAVITQFGRYKATVGAGFNWRLPYPIQRHELVVVTQIRSTDVGRDTIVRSTGLRESAMLTEDENIVEIKFAVQYRLSDARAYLYESKTPADTVVQVAETAVREVVGKMKMDAALAEERDQIAPRVRALMQTILDRYKVGVEVVGINLQQGGVRPPEQVQASFDDVLKAGQERERAKNEAQAYANDVVPRATGTASRLMEESEAYKARIIAQAQGDAQRFASVLTEYQKAPQVTRDRMYTDAMQQIYASTTKVLVDSKQGSNLLYLPLDRLMQMSGQGGAGTPVDGANPNVAGTAPPQSSVIPVVPPSSGDARARDGRSRDRDVR